MNQAINLYQAILRKRNIPLSFQVMKNIVFGFLILLVTTTVVLFLMQLKNARDLSLLEEKQSNANNKLKEQSSKMTPRANREQTIAQLEATEKELSKNKNILQTLSTIQQTHELGFSNRMAALSNSTQTGLWLTKFEFLGGGDYFSLSGKTINPNLITRFIDLLSKEPIFSGKSLEVLKMELDPKDSFLNFTLKTYETK